jgi:hypothetical protein
LTNLKDFHRIARETEYMETLIETDTADTELSALETIEQQTEQVEPQEDPDVLYLAVKMKFNLKDEQELEAAARELFSQGATVKYDFDDEIINGQRTIVGSKLLVNNEVIKSKKAIGAHENSYYDKVASLVGEYQRAGMPEEPIRSKAANSSIGKKRGRLGKPERAEILRLWAEKTSIESIAKIMNRKITVIDDVINEIRV